MGDSRITGIMNSNLINESNTVYGIGYGYNWLVGNGTFDSGYTNAINGAIEGLNQKMQDKTSYNIIIWLGINDYTYISAQEYFNKYYEIASSSWANHNIYIVSLGPIDETKNTSLTNESINNFNTLLQSYINFSGLNNLKYIDLNLDSSTLSYDETGLHYSTSDYQKIYNIINLNIDNNISSNLSLYDLNEYCTYYNITENDSYWWPIGSSSPTEGNIYGGEPSTTLVTSYFGYRVVEGKTSYHQGIDISGGSDCYNNIIVAAKSGVVRYVNDTCSTTGYYGNQCGGEYGNWVMIEHDDGTSTVYAHMSLGSITVNVGDNVVQGQKIGKMGSSGSSTGCHLHFEVRINGSKVNPLDYVSVDNPRPMTPNFEYQDGNGSYKNAVCSTLLASGYSENAVAGIMVNLNAESGFSPINLQNTYEKKLGYKDEEYTVAVDKGIYDNFVNDSAGYGIAQWTHYSRKQKLYDLAKSQNKSIGALDMQIEFLLDEIATNSGFSVTHKYITGNYEANDIATNFCYNFERPKSGLEGCKKRANTYTDSMLNYVKNGCN